MTSLITDNLLELTDSYKASHWKQYPPNTTKVYSYFESRGGEFKETVFFGLQYFLYRYLSDRITMENLDQAKALYREHLGPGVFNEAGWFHIINTHEGKLPLRIKAVPEGSVVPTNNVLMTVENTCPQCYWLTNYIETLLVQTWYPTTVATLSRECKKMISTYLQLTGDQTGLPFKLHDFGFRGVSSVESASIGGAAHLVNFQGTDTVAALRWIRTYYGSDEIPGVSIPASEHSTITAWGASRELDAYKNMLEQYPTGLVACVSDSYDIWNAVQNIWGKALRDSVIARDGTLVIRPDSGDPAVTVTGVVSSLGEAFGYTTNEKGYKVLDPHVRVIQGDGVDYSGIYHVLDSLLSKGWAADNVSFGMGGGLLQKLNRDTQKFAFKCSYIEVDGKCYGVRKAPVGDQTKSSKAGRLALFRNLGGYGWKTIRIDRFDGFTGAAASDWNELAPETRADVEKDRTSGEVLELVFENGEILRHQTFDSVRRNAQL